MEMIFFTNRVRCRKRGKDFVGSWGRKSRSIFSISIGLVILLQFLALFMLGGVSGDSSISFITSSNLVVNLGTFLVIYSAFPHLSTAKSIRNGKEVEEPMTFANASISETSQNQSSSEPSSIIFSSRNLQVSEENSTLSPSEERETNLDSESSSDGDDDEEEGDSTDANLKEYRKKRKKQKRLQRKEKGFNRLKRQMGMAAEIAVLAPALQTMGCIPKFFCGMNSRQPSEDTTTLNDLAYLIKFAMLDDDDVDLEDPLFAPEQGGNRRRPLNNRGKDGLTRIKEDLIIENLAEEEMIQEDPANLPFVMQDMDTRIKTKTKPGNKQRWDDELLDAIIVEPEQTAMGSLFTGIKSIFRRGKSSQTIFNNQSSQVTPRSGRSTRSANDKRQQRMRRRWKQRPFYRTPQFRQDMELAHRIGRVEQDDAKCSTTFNVCPYTVHEMMDIVHGGYRRRQRKKKKKKPAWYVNAQGPPQDSSEETSNKKPFKDPDNLITTTTPRSMTYVTDPEHQIYYAMFPHKAVEIGVTTIPTTRRPRPSKVKTTTEEPELDYDPSSGVWEKKRRRRPESIQGHVEYENANDEEGSLESKRPEQFDMMINNKQPNHRFRKPGGSPSWWGGGKRPQHLGNAHDMHIRPMNGPQNDQEGEEEEQSSEEEEKRKKRMKKKKEGGNASESAEDEEGASSEEKEKSDSTPPPTQAPSDKPIQIQGPGGFAAIQDEPYQHEQVHSSFTFNQDFQSMKLKHSPIATARPKYTIQNMKPKKPKKKAKLVKATSSLPPPPPPPQPAKQKQNQEQSKKEEKSNEETSDEEEQDEESRENSSEERPNTMSSSPPNVPPQQQSPLYRPPNFPVMGRPSEEVRDHHNNHHHMQNPLMSFPENNNNDNNGDNSDEEAKNSNSAPVDGDSKEMGGPLPPHMKKSSNEYTYSDEGHGQPAPMRPITYSYFKKGSREVPNGHNMQGPPPQQQRPQETAPPSTTQKYSTGFLSFLFRKKKKRGSYENSQQQPQYDHQQRPRESREEEDEEDGMDDDDDDDDESPERAKSPRPTITGPDGKFEVGHLRPPPKALKPDFQPPKKPERPYRGATSMEDSDEKHKRGRATPAPPTPQSSKYPESNRPLLFIGKPHRIIIPPPATPPPPTTTPPPTLPYSTPKPESKDSEESDEDRQSEESREDDDSKENSSEEKIGKLRKGSTTPNTKTPERSNLPHADNSIPFPPLANLGSILPENVLAVSGPVEIPDPARTPSTTLRPPAPPRQTATPSKTNSEYRNSEEKQGDDSNQTKEDDSEEETKQDEDRSEENSDEEKDSSEEVGGKKKRPPPPKRKPEDDELEHPSNQFPPLPPVGGDIAAVEEILGIPPVEDQGDDDEAIDAFGGADNIPAAPPLALQGFSSSLEIVVPTRAPAIKIPALNNNPNGATPNNFGGTATGVPNQAGGGSNGQAPGGGNRDPYEQLQQGVRNPGSSSNRGPGNRRPSQQQQGQEGQDQNKKQKGKTKEDGKKKKGEGEDNSSEEKNSSEENKNKSEDEEESSEETNNNPVGNNALNGFPTNEFNNEAILNLGYNGDDDENGGGQGNAAGNNPPPPPPIFTKTGQKHELHKHRPFLPRPVTPSTPVFYRPKPKGGPGRNEPILKNQLPHNQYQLLQQHQPQTVPVFAFKPSAAAVLRPIKRPHQQPSSSSSNSFLVSHLLRPFTQRPAGNPNTRKPLDPKVVQWIKETYGIPDLNGQEQHHNHNPNNGNRHPFLPSPMQLHGPNRAGLESEAEGSGPSSSSKKTKVKAKTKSKSKPKTPIIKSKNSASSEKIYATSKEAVEKKVTATTTTTTTTTIPPPVTSTTFREKLIIKLDDRPSTTTTTTTTTTVPPPSSTSTSKVTPMDLFKLVSSLSKLDISPNPSKKSKVPATTLTTTESTTETASTTSTKTPKLPPDYITEDEESKMAQALFSSEEEEDDAESEEESSESDSDANESRIKSQVKTKVGNHKLIITVKSIANNTKSGSSHSKKSSTIEKLRPVVVVKSKSKSKISSSAEADLRKKLNLKLSSSSSEKIKKSSSSEREKVSPSSKEKKHSKSSSSEHRDKKKTTSSPGKKGTKARPTSSSTYFPKNTVTVNSKPVASTPKPRPKPIKLPPIYGKHTHHRKG